MGKVGNLLGSQAVFIVSAVKRAEDCVGFQVGWCSGSEVLVRRGVAQPG